MCPMLGVLGNWSDWIGNHTLQRFPSETIVMTSPNQKMKSANLVGPNLSDANSNSIDPMTDSSPMQRFPSDSAKEFL